MKLSHKLRKLVRFDGLQSAAEHVRRWSHPVPVKPMLRALGTENIAALQRRYDPAAGVHPVGDSAKFANVEYWLKVNVERAQDFDLDRQSPQRVLDLGCGAGYFLYVCEQLGHTAVGLDIDENPLFRETIALLDVQRVTARIEAGTPLPDLGERFDLVTAHCICFQKLPPSETGQRREWGADDWRYFLADLRDHVLQPGGRIVLDFNPRGQGVFYPDAVGELFRREGARIFRSKVIFPGG